MTSFARFGPRLRLILLVAMTFAALLLAPYLGGESVDPLGGARDLIAGRDSQAGRILTLRLPRIVLGLVAGGALALAGAAMQTLLRNALATPYTLGVSFAGALGAFLALSVDALSFAIGPLPSTAVFAFLLAGADVVALYILVRRPQRIDTNELLLAGVTLNFFFGASILLVRFLTDPLRLRAMDQWIMGGLQVGSWTELAPVPVLLAPGIALLLGQARGLDQLAFGEELAAARGVDVLRSQRIVLLAASLVTAAVVAVTGPIGFVGLIAPHATRGLLGPYHRLLLPGAFLLGGSFLVLADGAARSLSWAGRGSELPVGILTAMLGAPLFLLLLLRLRRTG
jgi:iron complex transport system permease protein